MIYFTGDTHGDKNRLSKFALKQLKSGDTLIVCGDFGFLWDESKKEKKFLEKLSKRNMALYVNIEDEKNSENNMPEIQKRVIKLNTNIPEDEDFGL